MKFDITKIFEGGYNPVRCACGGSLYAKSDGKDLRFTCMHCKKTYKKWELEYDQIGINTMTGWTFPMVRRKKEDLEK